MRAPKRFVTAALAGDSTTIARPPGSIATPAAMTDMPKPYPVISGICSCWVVVIMLAYMAKPTSRLAAFVSSTGRRAEVRRSTIGEL